MMPPRSCRVLVIEDEAFILLLLEEALTGAGCDVILATGGEEALALARQQPPDVAVMDLRLADGLAGPEFLGRLREVVPSLPVVIATGLRLTEQERRGYDLAGGGPPVLVLQKPCDMEHLVAEVLARHGGGRGG